MEGMQERYTSVCMWRLQELGTRARISMSFWMANPTTCKTASNRADRCVTGDAMTHQSQCQHRLLYVSLGLGLGLGLR